jgi:competence ComEA-like helix-hairpin-helix protein
MFSAKRVERALAIVLVALSTVSGCLNMLNVFTGESISYIASAQELPDLETQPLLDDKTTISKEDPKDNPKDNHSPKNTDLPSEQSKIDVNTATLDLLVTLPGIGKVIGQRIIDLRKKRGGFVYLEELLDVSGIGKARFEKIKSLIWLSPIENGNDV